MVGVSRRELLVIGVVALLIVTCYVWTFVTLYNEVWADDQYITLRYAQMFAEHGVIGYNPGQHDEGSSDILFTSSIGLLHLVTGADLFLLTKLLDLLFGFAAFVLIYLLLREFTRSTIALAVTLLLIAADATLLIYTVIGTENTLYLATLFLTLLLFVRASRWRRGKIAVPLYPFAALLNLYVRQEGVILVLALIGSALIVEFVQLPSRKRTLGGYVRRLVDRRALELSLLVAVLILFVLFKLLYFGHLASPPTLRKATHLAALTPAFVWSNLLAILKQYWYLFPGVAFFFLFRKTYAERLPFAAFSALFILAHLVLRSTLQPDYGRYFNQVSIFLFVIAAIGYSLAFLASKWPQRAAVAACLVALVIIVSWVSSTRLTAALDLWDGFTELHPVDYSYVPAGKFIGEHSCPDALVASSEAGAPVYFSNRRYHDLSGLTDYRYARIWRANSEIMREDYFYTLITEPPQNRVLSPQLEEYYRLFFEAKPDFVYLILNPPSYLIAIHPDFQANYVEVWRKQRQDAFRGYYAVWARTDSSCVIGLNLSQIIVNDVPYVR